MVEFKAYVEPDNPGNPFYKDGTVDYDRVQGTNPLSGGEYPKMLYRAGGTEKVHGVMVDTMIVHDDVEEEALSADGWRATPKKAEAFGEALLSDGALVVDTPRRGRPPRVPDPA